MELASFAACRKTESARPLTVALLVAAAMPLGGCEEDDVRFGPPNNLRRERSGNFTPCPPPSPSPDAKCPDWATEVFPLLDGAAGRCTNESCHSATSPHAGLVLYAGEPDASYASLAAYEDANGRPYVGDGDTPEEGLDPYFLCNLTAAPLVGTRMPLGGAMPPDALVLMRDWVSCGMRGPGGAGPTAGANEAGGGT